MAAARLPRAVGVPAVVCVPARNEAGRLPRLLRSLDGQAGIDLPLRVAILVNDSHDGTAEAARDLRASGALAGLDLRVNEVTLPPANAHAGTARRMALAAGRDWLASDGIRDGILLTTDADAWLPPDWVAANLAALGEAEIVGGRLVIARDGPGNPARDDLDARIERYWQAVRAVEDRLDPPPHDPPPRHGDHTGASLALRAGLYEAVGGLPPLPRGEDNALVAAVTCAGGRLRHCPRIAVHVSDRAVGRAEDGMALDMARRGRVLAGRDAYLLPEPGHWLALVARRARLRRAWRDRGIAGPNRVFGLTDADVAAIGDCPNDIAFVERAARRLAARDAPAVLVPLDEALAAFSRIVAVPA